MGLVEASIGLNDALETMNTYMSPEIILVPVHRLEIKLALSTSNYYLVTLLDKVCKGHIIPSSGIPWLVSFSTQDRVLV